MSERGKPVDGLLIIDVQVGHVQGDHAVPDARPLAEQVAVLLDAAREAGALVVHVQNDGEEGQVDAPGTPGWELHFAPVAGETVIRKEYDDAFRETSLEELLTAAEVKSLVVCGLMSEMCVSATARTALDRGYRVVLPHDAHGTTGVPGTPGLGEAIPAAVVSRVAEWALGDGAGIVPHAKTVTFSRRG
ncbi:cysteine hydrolase family protein [Kribbella italica]|uniref:Nicotinamidase-related amidase n=1 Tax=Kribbella italica TaxID=1540520 RepID=A0A7W9J370_9ACTN|nr:cysteine hydrolase family protein [Kribbella italica]MBB5834222.1 nicotinamidase-related amidase [Kribbella italica]